MPARGRVSPAKDDVSSQGEQPRRGSVVRIMCEPENGGAHDRVGCSPRGSQRNGKGGPEDKYAVQGSGRDLSPAEEGADGGSPPDQRRDSATFKTPMGSRRSRESRRGSITTETPKFKASRRASLTISSSGSDDHPDRESRVRRLSCTSRESISRRVSRMMAPTLTVDTDERSKGFLLDPDSRLALYWSFVMLFVIAYNMFIVPFQIAFIPFEGLVDALWLTGLGCDMLYTADIVLTFNSGYYENGNKIMMRTAISKRYVKNLWSLRRRSFLRDLVSTIPVDMLEFAVPNMRGSLRLNRLIRSPRIFLIMHELLDRKLGRHAVQVIQLVVAVAMQIHLIACTWFLFGVIERFGEATWLPSEQLGHDASIGKQFIASIYQALGMTIGVIASGQPTTTAQSIMHTVVMILSLLMFAYAIGVVSSIEGAANERALQFQAQLQYVRQVLRKHNVPVALFSRVQSYLGYTNSFGERHSIAIMNELPEGMRADMLQFLFERRLLAVPALTEYKSIEGFIPTMVTKLTPAVFIKDEVLLQNNSRPSHIYLLLHGRASAQNALGREERQLQSGDFCGDELFENKPSEHHIQARTPCECMALSREALADVFHHYPAAKTLIDFEMCDARFRQDACRPILALSAMDEEGSFEKDFQDDESENDAGKGAALSHYVLAKAGNKSRQSRVSPPPSPPTSCEGCSSALWHGRCADAVVARHKSDKTVEQAQQRVKNVEIQLRLAKADLMLAKAEAQQQPAAVVGARAELELAKSELHAATVAQTRCTRSDRQRARVSCRSERPASMRRRQKDSPSPSSRHMQHASLSPSSIKFPCTSPPPSPPEDDGTYEASPESSAPAETKHLRDAWLSRAPWPLGQHMGPRTRELVERLKVLIERLPLIAPHSRHWRVWLGTVLVASWYTAFVLPLRYGYVTEPHVAFKLLDVLSDIVFFSDFVARFLLSYYDEFSLVTSRCVIFRRYLRSLTLYVNLLSVLPMFASIATGYENPWVRISMIVRCVQVPLLGMEYLDATSNNAFFSMADARYSTRKLVNIAYTFVMMAHVCACFFGAVDPDVLPRSYSYGLWWAVTALTGFGTIPTLDTGPQLLFASVVLSGSLFVSTYIIGNMGVLISNLDPVGVVFAKKRDAVDRFVLNQAVPQELASRLHLYLQLVWTRGAGTNLTHVVSQMNATLRRDIMHQVCFAVFITVPMFGSCGPRLISALIETMVMEVFPQHEWVCHKGSIASAMYIVLEGAVSVVIDEKRMIVVKRLNRGEFFGERSLFGAEIRNASIQAKTTVEVVVLLAETFRRMIADPLVLEENPKLAQEIKNIEKAKWRREQEMHAACDVVDEFKRNSCLSSRGDVSSRTTSGSSAGSAGFSAAGAWAKLAMSRKNAVDASTPGASSSTAAASGVNGPNGTSEEGKQFSPQGAWAKLALSRKAVVDLGNRNSCGSSNRSTHSLTGSVGGSFGGSFGGSISASSRRDGRNPGAVEMHKRPSAAGAMLSRMGLKANDAKPEQTATTDVRGRGDDDDDAIGEHGDRGSDDGTGSRLSRDSECDGRTTRESLSARGAGDGANVVSEAITSGLVDEGPVAAINLLRRSSEIPDSAIERPDPN